MSTIRAVHVKASGKLMLFGEYLVLQGANCLAIPLKFGQELMVEPSMDELFHWESKNHKGEVWFSVSFTRQFEIQQTSNEETAQVLLDLLRLISLRKPFLFQHSLQFRASVDFDLAWGLGSSSTLISLLAQWSKENPFELLKESFGGSGYDVACATEDSPICYSVKDRSVTHIRLSPAITNKILFVYCGNKQNSKNEIKRFSGLTVEKTAVEQMNELIDSVQTTHDIVEFEKCMENSELLLSNILQMPTLKSSKFSDYPYMVKSLGAWGGDFFMATYRDEQEAKAYFSSLGFKTFFTYSEMIKN